MDPAEARTILGIDGNPTPERLKAAFRRVATKVHPDRFQTFTEKAWATKRFVRARQAYELLRAEPARGAVATGRPGPRVSPIVVDLTPEDLGIEFEIDPFRGYQTIVMVLMLPVRLVTDSVLSDWLAHRSMAELLMPLVALLMLFLFPGQLGMLAILLPVVIVHTLTLGAGIGLDLLRGDEDRRVSDLIAGSHFFLLIEVVVGGGILVAVLTHWFGTEPITRTEIVLGVALWAPPTAYLLIELKGFLASVLASSR